MVAAPQRQRPLVTAQRQRPLVAAPQRQRPLVAAPQRQRPLAVVRPQVLTRPAVRPVVPGQAAAALLALAPLRPQVGPELPKTAPASLSPEVNRSQTGFLHHRLRQRPHVSLLAPQGPRQVAEAAEAAPALLLVPLPAAEAAVRQVLPELAPQRPRQRPQRWMPA